MHFSSQYAKINDTNIHYFDIGNGPVLLLLHGFPQNNDVWRFCIPMLSKHFRVIAPDARGMGKSALCPTGQDKKTLTDDLIELLDHLSIESVWVMGHDWGGAIAQRLVLAYPHRVNGLICAGVPYIPQVTLKTYCHPKNIFSTWYVFFHQTTPLCETLMEKCGDEYLAWILKEGSANHHYPNLKQAIELYRSAFSTPDRIRAYLNLYRTAFKQDINDWQPYINTRIEKPSLWFHLKQDRFIPTQSPDFLNQHLAHLQYQEIGCGHWLPEENPERLSETIIEFVKQHC